MTSCVVVLVLAKPYVLQDVLQAWESAGAPGATVLESTGLSRLNALFGRDDLPLFPSPRWLLEHQEAVHYTIFSVLDDDSLVDTLISATEQAVGDLTEPDRGILFTLPLARIVGYRHKQDEGRKDGRP